jgi:hypothetical protein
MSLQLLQPMASVIDSCCVSSVLRVPLDRHVYATPGELNGRKADRGPLAAYKHLQLFDRRHTQRVLRKRRGRDMNTLTGVSIRSAVALALTAFGPISCTAEQVGINASSSEVVAASEALRGFCQRWPRHPR